MQANDRELVTHSGVETVKIIVIVYGSPVKALKETAYSFLTEKHELEYLEILDSDTLEGIINANNNSIALIACKVDNVRLIDNVYLGEK